MIPLGLVVALIAPPPVAASPWVTVRGQVVWPKAAARPEPEAVIVTTDRMHCCGAGPLPDESLVVDPKTRGIRNVIVWLRPDDDSTKAAVSLDRIHPDLVGVKPREHTIEMPRCRFVPRVLAARAGDVLKAKNSSPVAHTFHLQGVANVTNRLLPAQGEAIVLVESLKAEPGGAVSFRDAIHPWMTGHVRVFDHPYFAVTDCEGRFEIPKVPAGKWRIVYWHEKGYHKGRDGRLGFLVTVKDNGAARQSLPPLEYEMPKSK